MSGPDSIGEQRMKESVDVRFQDEDLELLNRLVEEHYHNRSVAIREAVRNLAEEELDR